MSERRYITDFGGDHYGRPKMVPLTRNNIRSFRCSECNTLNYFTLSEVTRAALRHCLRCGGTLEETRASYCRHVESPDAIENSEIRPDGVESKNKVHRCTACGTGWSDENALMYHLVRQPDCLERYYDPNDLVVIGDRIFLFKTLHVHDMGTEHVIEGITAAGRLEDVCRAKTKKQGQALLLELQKQ